MWISKEKLEMMISGGESVLQLKTQIRKLKDEIESLKVTKKMEQREIEHLIKLKEEKLNIEHQKKEVELQKQFQEKEMAMQQNFHSLTIKNIETAQKDMKDIYTQIMERLPNITASLEVRKGAKK